ncbi:MAG: hypothetical protein ACOX4X_07180 [Aminobacterium colombiense]|jgi:hypothetical protein
MRRTKPLLAIGVAIAAIGIVTCFIPDIFNNIPRILLLLCFGLGGFLLFLQMLFSKDKLLSWLKYGGIFHSLVFGCGVVYLLSILIGALILKHNLLTTSKTAVVIMVYGVTIIYLAEVLRKIYLLYPEAEKLNDTGIALSTDKAMILLTGIFMILLGVLLIPVNLGLLPFSGSAQLGLLMTIFAIQMLAFGNTPIGPFPRSWPIILFGLLFAALGITSCIIPEILVSPLTVLVGVLNILGGAIMLWRICSPILKKRDRPRDPVPLVLVKLTFAQVTLNLVSVLFGTSMLVAHMIPGRVIGVILTINGCVLLYLLHILKLLDKM